MTEKTKRNLFIYAFIAAAAIIVGLLTTVIVLAVSNSAVGSTINVKFNPPLEFEYTLNTSAKTATITNYIGDKTEVEIPSTIIDGETTYNVTELASRSFENKTAITKITIPNSIISIDNYAFYNCSGLTSITVPNSVQSIGNNAFSSCNMLQSITIPFVGLSREATGEGAKLYHIFGASSIPKSLKSVTITDATNIGQEAFAYGGYLITTIVLNEGIVNIDREAFRSCESLINITIPNSVTSIGEQAFKDCFVLTSVSFKSESQLASISNEAFSGCSKLTNITIPNGVVSIGNKPFESCRELTSIKVDSGNAVYEDRGANAIIEKSTNTLIVGCKTTVIPNSVTSIGSRAFSGCTSLTNITIPNSVTSIGSYAFYDCRSLTSIAIPNSVTSIGSSAFYNCSGLTSITIPNSVTSIGNQAFVYCSGLTSLTLSNSITSIGISTFSSCTSLISITIPNSVTSIGDFAFIGCTSLTTVTLEGDTLKTGGSNMFMSCNSLTSIYVESWLVDDYKAATNWVTYKDYFVQGPWTNLWNPAWTPRLDFTPNPTNTSHSLEFNISQNPAGYIDSLTTWGYTMREAQTYSCTFTAPVTGTYYVRIGYNGNAADDKYINPMYLEAGTYTLTVDISTNVANHIVVKTITMNAGSTVYPYKPFVGAYDIYTNNGDGTATITRKTGYSVINSADISRVFSPVGNSNNFTAETSIVLKDFNYSSSYNTKKGTSSIGWSIYSGSAYYGANKSIVVNDSGTVYIGNRDYTSIDQFKALCPINLEYELASEYWYAETFLSQRLDVKIGAFDTFVDDGDGTVMVTRKTGNKVYHASDVKLANSQSSIVYYSVPRPTNYILYNSYSGTIKFKPTKFTTEGNSATLNTEVNIGKMHTVFDSKNFWIGFAAGTTLEQAQAAIDGLAIEYELAEGYQYTEGFVINHPEITIGAYDTYVNNGDGTLTITRKTGSITLNGKEAWQDWTNPNGTAAKYILRPAISGVFQGSTYMAILNGKSNSLTIQNENALYAGVSGISFQQMSDYTQICIRISGSDSSASKVISYLTQAPVAIQYELASSTTETVNIN